MYAEEYLHHDGLGLAALIREGAVSREEVFAAACRRIEALNPRLNALVRTRFERARDELARVRPEAPFAGVPFLTKDLALALAGEPLATGSAALRDWRAPQDSTLVARYRDAGLVILGQTNTPELGLMGITEPHAFGATHNPWSLDHSPGGSSGGAAAAVAAGMVPLASAADGGGSIRIPASNCGLFGFKPSRGRLPQGPSHAELWEGAVSEGVLTRSVRDTAAILDTVNGMDRGAPFPLFHEDGWWEAVQRPPRPLRVAVSLRSPMNPEGAGQASVHAEVRQAVENAAARLESLGHHIEWQDPPAETERVAACYLTLYLGQVAAHLAWISAQTGVAVERLDIEPATRALGRLGRALPAPDYLVARQGWNDLARAMGRFHARYEVLLCPVLAGPPPRTGQLYPSRTEQRLMRILALPGMARLALRLGALEHLAHESLAYLPFTQLANLTGQPAMSVPLHWTSEGLPVGVQLIAAMGDDRRLLSLAAQLEQAQPWAHKLPVTPDGAGLER